jgi:hypothetical protein
MIRDTTRSPGTDEHPTYRRRRSVSRVPASKWNLAAAERAFEAGRRRHAEEQHQEERQQHQQHQQQSKSTQKRGDPLAALAVMPKPVKPSRLHPSLRRFMSGRSSLWAVAMALHDRHHRRRALKARMAQSCLWAGLDQKELVAELNTQSQNAPDLPEALSVRLRICRTTLVSLVHELGMRGFRYEGIKDVYVFFKSAEKHTRLKNKNSRSGTSLPRRAVVVADEDQITPALVKNVSLSSASVVLFVGANHPPGGVPNSDGLGHLYMSTGKVVSGESALALRVLDALSKK